MIRFLTKSAVSNPASRCRLLPLSSSTSSPLFSSPPSPPLSSLTVPFTNKHQHQHQQQQQQHNHYSSTTPNPTKDDDNNDDTTPTFPSFAINDDDNLTESEINALVNAELELQDAADAAKFNPNWKPGYRRRPLQISYKLEDFENEHNPDKWIPNLNRRCGGLAIKVGMMPLWDEWGERHACTVLFMDTNVVLRTFTEEADGYFGVQLGAGARKRKNVKATVMGHYEKYLPELRRKEGEEDVHPSLLADPPYLVREFRCTHGEYLPTPGSAIHARHFVPGQNVDIAGISKGKGFQGAMKRWNFKGMPATHGTSLSHRHLGSTGQCQDPGRVFKGKKMAGRMGGKRNTKQNSRILKIDRGRDLIYVKGAVPGQKGNYVEIRDSVKKPLFATEKVEEGVRFPPLPTFGYEEGVDGSGEGGFEVMMPMPGEDPFNPVESQAA